MEQRTSQDLSIDATNTAALSTSLRGELAAKRDEFHQIREGLAEADLARPSTNPAWTVGEILVHIVYWLDYTPVAVELVRHPTSWRSRVSRAVPAFLYDRINVLLTRQAARHQTRQTIAQRYELAYQVTLTCLESIRADEWAVGAPFASFHGEYRTIARIFRSDVEHQTEHLREIHNALPANREAKGRDGDYGS